MSDEASIESPNDPKELSPRERWDEEVTTAEKELKKFHGRARKVVKKYLDERDTMDATQRWFNIFYANSQILESALYAQIPKPNVSRRFKDYQDDVARVAAIIVERCITQDLDDPRDTFDSTMRSAVQDRLIPGLSMAWLRLETDTETIPPEEGGALEPDDLITEPQPGMETEEVGETAATESGAAPEPMKRITDQRVVIDYVFWEDFLWSPCRVWEERRWTGRRVYMSRAQLVERFGEKKGRQVPLTSTDRSVVNVGLTSTPKNEAIKKACVYEIWCREDRKVIWFSKGVQFLLDEVDDPLGLVGFEPHPTPMLANISTSNTAPRPDYYMIQDQYTELDNVNNRISMLIKACKVIGTYDKGQPAIGRMLTETYDNQLVPVDNWAMFAEKGGLKGQIDWLPLDMVVAALTQLNLAREAIKGQIYELTGIADIVRGASKASETLGAQQIKAQFASVRIKKLQDEVARFASEILRIKAELTIKHFSPEMLVKKSNIAQTDNQELIGPALELLKQDDGFEWRIEVTADSIAQADYAMEKADRLEFLTSVSAYLEKAGAMFQAVPQSAPLLIGMLKWAVAGFRNASEIEGMLDKELDALQKQPPQDKPDPVAAKAQADMAILQAKASADQQKNQMDMQAKQQDMALKERMGQMELQMKQMELDFERQKLELDRQKALMEMNYARAESDANLKAKYSEQQLALSAQEEQHKQAAKFSQQNHEQALKQKAVEPKAKTE